MATGFHTRVPYLDESYFEWKGNRPQLYMRLANPTHPTLFAMGFTEGDGGAYELFDEMADLVANAATTFATGGPAAARWMQQMRTDQPDLQGGVKHVDSDRHQSYLHLVPYRHHYKSIYKKFGWTPVRTGSFASLRRSKAPAA